MNGVRDPLLPELVRIMPIVISKTFNIYYKGLLALGHATDDKPIGEANLDHVNEINRRINQIKGREIWRTLN